LLFFFILNKTLDKTKGFFLEHTLLEKYEDGNSFSITDFTNNFNTITIRGNFSLDMKNINIGELPFKISIEEYTKYLEYLKYYDEVLYKVLINNNCYLISNSDLLNASKDLMQYENRLISKNDDTLILKFPLGSILNSKGEIIVNENGSIISLDDLGSSYITIENFSNYLEKPTQPFFLDIYIDKDGIYIYLNSEWNSLTDLLCKAFNKEYQNITIFTDEYGNIIIKDIMTGEYKIIGKINYFKPTIINKNGVPFININGVDFKLSDITYFQSELPEMEFIEDLGICINPKDGHVYKLGDIFINSETSDIYLFNECSWKKITTLNMQKGCEKKDSPIPLIGTFFFNECTLECFIYDGEKWKKITDGNLIYKLGKDLASLNGLINEKTLEIYFYNNNIIKKIEDIKIESNNTTDIVLKKESLLVLEEI
jgi:predicted transport protein